MLSDGPSTNGENETPQEQPWMSCLAGALAQRDLQAPAPSARQIEPHRGSRAMGGDCGNKARLRAVAHTPEGEQARRPADLPPPSYSPEARAKATTFADGVFTAKLQYSSSFSMHPCFDVSYARCQAL